MQSSMRTPYAGSCVQEGSHCPHVHKKSRLYFDNIAKKFKNPNLHNMIIKAKIDIVSKQKHN